MKHLIPLLAFSFLIGCDGEKSNATLPDGPIEDAATEAPSEGSLKEAASKTKSPEAVSVNPNLKYKIEGDAVTITGCDKKALGDLIIPAKIEGKPVTSIGVEAFSKCNALTSITIPDSVTSIESSSFVYCDGLRSITIPDSVTSIGNHAFNRCRGLTSITIGNGVTSIGIWVFNSCESLTSITIPDGVTNIEEGTFGGCDSLTTIEVDTGNVNFTSINGVLVHKERTLLHTYPAGKTDANYVIPDGVTSIGFHTFDSCKNLTSINIPDSVTSIGDAAFGKCDSLRSITIPDSVTSIGDGAFENCSSLTSITIGNGVISIGGSAFNRCTNLTTIEVSTGNMNYTDVEGVLFNRGKTLLNTYPAGKGGPNYVIPDSVTSIGTSAFYNCTSLASITIPDGVTSIEGGVFAYCISLKSITIPDSVTSIGRYAFNGCTSLTALTFLGDAPKIANYAFVGSSPTIYRKPDAKGWGDTLAGSPVIDREQANSWFDDIEKANRNTKEIEDSELAAKDVDDFEEFDNAKVEKAIRDFVTAESPAELKKYIRDFERVGPLLDRYYEKVDYETVGFEALDMTQMKYNGDVVTMLVQKADFLSSPIAVERVVDGEEESYQIDWESWVGYCDYTPEQMRVEKPDKPFLMRVIVKPMNYYNYDFSDDVKWRSLGLELKDSIHSFLGYVERDSEQDKKFRVMMKGGQVVACMVRVAYPTGSRSKDQVEILEIVGSGWLQNLKKDK